MRLNLLPPLPASTPTGFETGPRSIAAVRMLRISVTDRCNFRCTYCMPADGVRWLPKDEVLSFEEIVEIVSAAIEIHGIRRFKLTGGEPTLRHGIVDLVRMLRKLPGLEDLSLTTNGALLESLAGPLRDAGLDRLTVSVDSLKPDRFRAITRTGDLATVLRGLDRAQAVGFPSIKINCVTMRGVNDDELADFARLTVTHPYTVRFIEYMPLGDAALLESGNPFQATTAPDGSTHYTTSSDRLPSSPPISPPPHHPISSPQVADEEQGPAAGCGSQARGDVFISESFVRDQIESALGPLLPVDRDTEPGVGPATVFRLAIPSAIGRIGFISAMSEPFCSTCNRLRLTATGVLRSCLFEGGEVNARTILRSTESPSDRRQSLATAMTDCVKLRPTVHGIRGNEQMSRIGG